MNMPVSLNIRGRLKSQIDFEVILFLYVQMPPSVGCSPPEPSRSARPHHSASLHGPPSYGAEGGTGSRRRQPSASAANENKIAILLIIKGIAIAFVIENYYLVVAKKINNSIKQWQR